MDRFARATHHSIRNIPKFPTHTRMLAYEAKLFFICEKPGPPLTGSFWSTALYIPSLYETVGGKMWFSKRKTHHMDFHPWDIKSLFGCSLSFSSIRMQFGSVLTISDSTIETVQNHDFQEKMQINVTGSAPPDAQISSIGNCFSIFWFSMQFWSFDAFTMSS